MKSPLAGSRSLPSAARRGRAAPAWWTLAVAFAGALAAGCSVIAATDGEQCQTDVDCTARGGAFAGSQCVDFVCTPPPPDPRWACVGRVPVPVPAQVATETLQFFDLISLAPVAGATVKLCRTLDVNCKTPELTTATDADGKVSATVTSDFAGSFGYAEIDAPGFLPTIAFLDPPVDVRTPQTFLFTSEALETVLGTSMVTIDPAKGVILAYTVDCNLDPAAGVSVALDPAGGATTLYALNNAISVTGHATDASGNAGFVNVDPGAPTVIGTLGPDGVEQSRVTPLVRAGTVTYVAVRPTYQP